MSALQHEDFTFVDLVERPELQAPVDALVAENLPAFMMWASPGNWRWHRIFDLYPSYQVAALDQDGSVAAAVNTVPTSWSGGTEELPGGYDDVLIRATEEEAGGEPASTCLLSVSVRKRERGRGLARALILETKRRAGNLGHVAVIGPLRPIRKAEHPFVPMADYVAWTDGAGRPFDPWLRIHAELGAEILGVAERSLVVTQSRSRWEDLTGRQMSSPAAYLVEGALVPIEIDDRGMGTYAEPNVWVCHWIRGEGMG